MNDNVKDCPPYLDYPKPRKTITNYENLIRKTPEELAEFLYVKTCEDGYPQFGTTQEWLDWLKQEASE